MTAFTHVVGYVLALCCYQHNSAQVINRLQTGRVRALQYNTFNPCKESTRSYSYLSLYEIAVKNDDDLSRLLSL